MAVYTEVSDEDLARFVASYGLGDLVSYKGIAEGVENTNYLVDTSAGRYILTLYEKRVARTDLPFFLGLMQHLAANGISCPTPVRGAGGELLGELAGRPAAMVSFLEGVWIRRPQARHCFEVGRALANLHGAGRDFGLTRVNALGPAGWRPLYERFASRAAEINPTLPSLIERELDALIPNWPQGLPSGVIHADMFPDNVFFIGERLSGLIDFYFACNDAFAYDIAICLNAWCFEPDFSFNHTKGQAFLKGYTSIRPLQANEWLALPMLARGAALRFLLTRAHDWIHTSKDAFVKPHDPLDYVRRLRFHQGVTSAVAYGAGDRA